MAGPPFEAGSILIALRASAENLQKEIQKANATLQTFGKGVQDLAKTTEQTSAKVVQGFTAMDRKTAQLTARVAGFSQRLLGLQFVLSSFTNATAQAGEGSEKFGEKIQGLTGGLATFAGIVSIFPNKIGLIVGAIAGLTVFIVDLVRQLSKAGEEVQKFEKGLEELEKGRAQRQREREVEAIRLQQLRKAGITEVTSLESTLARIQAEQGRTAQDLVDAEDKRLKAIQARDALEQRIQSTLEETNRLRAADITEFGTPPPLTREEFISSKQTAEVARLTAALVGAGIETSKFREELLKLEKQAQEIQLKARLQKSFEDAIKVFLEFGNASARLRVQLQQGLIGPAEEVAAQLSVARQELEEFVKLGADSQRRISVLIDTKKNESAFDALTRRVIELQQQAKEIEIKVASEAEIKKLVESFRELRSETEKLGRDLSFGLVEPVQAAQTQLTNARDSLRKFLDLGEDQKLKISVEVLGVQNTSAALFLLIDQLNTAEEKAKEIKIGEDQARTVQEFGQFIESIPETLRPIQAQLTAGFITPLEAATQRARVLEDLITRVALAAVKVQGPGLQAALEQAQTTIDQLFERLEEEKKVIIDAELKADFKQGFAEPFSASIGDAVKRGILEGQDAMEVLAGVGENLFSKFLDQSIDFFQKGMTDALTSIAGAGGGILGGLFSGLVGLAGFFLSGRGGASTTQTFAGVNGQVESTQAVRGVVAGPESVSIAAVGDNLRRALIGVEARLDALIRISTQIRDGQGVGGTAAGSPFAGTVPTS